MIYSYDQTMTGSPYDDEPDWIQEAEKYLQNSEQDNPECHIINGLLDILDEEGVVYRK